MSRWVSTQPAIGQRFGRLTILQSGIHLEPNAAQKAKGWAGPLACLVRCDCGVEKICVEIALTRGATSSCGCLRDERVGDAHRIHGMWRHPSYGAWKNMRARANPNHSSYREGTIIYPPFNDARVFIEYLEENLGPKPDGHRLSIIDFTKGYVPGNLKWRSLQEILVIASEMSRS